MKKEGREKQREKEKGIKKVKGRKIRQKGEKRGRKMRKTNELQQFFKQCKKQLYYKVALHKSKSFSSPWMYNINS